MPLDSRVDKHLIDSMPDGLCVLDRHTRIVRTNRAMRDLLGITGTWAGRPCWEALHPEAPECRRCCARRALESGEEASDTVAMQNPDGRRRWLLHRAFPMRGDDGTADGVILLVRDITEQRENEARLRAAEERFRTTERRQNLLRMAGGIAHDFNNLLTAVIGNLDLARDALQKRTETETFLRFAREAAERASRLSSLMLTYTGQFMVHLEPADLNGIVSDLLPGAQKLVPPAVRLDCALSPEPLRAMLDAERIREAIHDLMLNAVEAIMADKGVIHLRTGREDLSAQSLEAMDIQAEAEPGAFVFVELSDDGCGMDEGTRRQLFVPFFTTKFTGRGLGLASVDGVVRAHRGAIRVDTMPARGTAITLFFPALAVAAG